MPAHAEQQIDERADRQQQRADKKVLKVENILAGHRVEAAPNVVAENARNASNKEHRADDADGFFSAPAPVVASAPPRPL